MINYKEIQGDLIKLALEGNFDVIAQGCNCFCVQGAGLAPQFVRAFHTDKFYEEHPQLAGKIEKLGNIDGRILTVLNGVAYLPEYSPKEVMFEIPDFELQVLNCYTQYGFGKNHENGTETPLDYEALTLCMRKINHKFKGKHIGLPLIGCGLAGGIWDFKKAYNPEDYEYGFYDIGLKKDVKTIIQEELKDCQVTIVHYKP